MHECLTCKKKSHWYWIKELVSNGLLIGWGALSAHLFFTVITKGRVYICEDIRWIVWAEFILSFLVIVLGVDRLIDNIRRLK